MKIIETMNADGWYFVFQKTSGPGYPAIFSRVILWQRYENNEVIGLIAAEGTTNDEGTIVNRLVTPPSVSGSYLHWDEMSEADREAALSQCRPGYFKSAST